MLIRKEFKQYRRVTQIRLKFESLVNTEGIQTRLCVEMHASLFESLVNTEGIQTIHIALRSSAWFESLVNTEGIQTITTFLEVQMQV